MVDSSPRESLSEMDLATVPALYALTRPINGRWCRPSKAMSHLGACFAPWPWSDVAGSAPRGASCAGVTETTSPRRFHPGTALWSAPL